MFKTPRSFKSSLFSRTSIFLVPNTVRTPVPIILPSSIFIILETKIRFSDTFVPTNTFSLGSFPVSGTNIKGSSDILLK